MHTWREIKISKVLSKDLALRQNAAALFDYLESLPEDKIVIDFSDVRTITRSFAQEYESRKAKSQKTIIESNVPINVKRMFDVIKRASEKIKLLDMKKVKPIMFTM
ncbi:hypothetical protein CW705_02820 [Candidatus Bathyarchaeota archaeon]|nr:MAG: hypothetical protein CW705_02820 [Candidatus Bathyarchaeota archaeon]